MSESDYLGYIKAGEMVTMTSLLRYRTNCIRQPIRIVGDLFQDVVSSVVVVIRTGQLLIIFHHLPLTSVSMSVG